MDKNKLHMEHVIECIENIYSFTEDIDSFEVFEKDIKTIRAVERELETMSQSIKDLGNTVHEISGVIDWKAIAGMRDILAHHYLVLSDAIIWDVVHSDLPLLEKEFRRYMKM
ncbi:DUF86 domain-containing protein [Candidatus Gracilibacteria bacterium]|nr:DUF86 domain-containing protein [Candidatus Gracilibacteria bacterium]